MYSKRDYGLFLKECLKHMDNCYKIGKSMSDEYQWKLSQDMEDDVDAVAHSLSIMESGPEFHYTIKELHQIADDLIAGKKPKLLK